MQCTKCGTEISDKALICYRCGTATAEPKVLPSAPRPQATRWLALVALGALVLAALFMGRAAVGDVPAPLVWVVVALASLAAVWRLLIRRR